MDNHTLDLEVLLRSLTEEEADACESDEKLLGEVFNKGWSEETSVRFHRAMLHARRVAPGATVSGIFEVALIVGLAFLDDPDNLACLHRGEDGVVVSVVVPPHSKAAARRMSCKVSPDVAALAKAGRGNKRRVRGL